MSYKYNLNTVTQIARNSVCTVSPMPYHAHVMQNERLQRSLTPASELDAELQ